MVIRVYCSIIVVWLISVFMPIQAWADAAYRSSSGTTYASRTNTTLTAPSGIQNGDVLIIVCSIAAALTAPTPTAPSGFATIAGSWPLDLTSSPSVFNVDTYIWHKIASGESGDYTVAHASASSQCYITAISGGSASQPTATANSGTGTSTTTALSITPVANNSLVMFVSVDWGDTANALSPPIGTTPTFTERLDPGTTAGIMYVADGVLATAGPTGNKSITNNVTDANSKWAGFLVAVEAGAAATTQPMMRRSLSIPGMSSYGIGGPQP